MWKVCICMWRLWKVCVRRWEWKWEWICESVYMYTCTWRWWESGLRIWSGTNVTPQTCSVQLQYVHMCPCRLYTKGCRAYNWLHTLRNMQDFATVICVQVLWGGVVRCCGGDEGGVVRRMWCEGGGDALTFGSDGVHHTQPKAKKDRFPQVIHLEMAGKQRHINTPYSGTIRSLELILHI